MARSFNGTSDDVILSLGALGFAFGPGTLAAVVRRVGTTKGIVISAGASGSVNYELGIEPHTSPDAGLLADQFYLWNGTSAISASSGMTLLESDYWCLIGVTKATGSVAPRLHKYVFSTGVWTHADGSATMANSSAPITKGTLGANVVPTSFFGGEMMIAAVWNVALTDAQMESLAQNLAYTWWQGVTTAPRAIWLFNQPDTVTTLPDLSGGGANQSSLAGTAVTGDPDLGFAVVSPPVYSSFPPRFSGV